MDSNDLNEINDHYYELVLITYKPFAVTAGSGFPGGGPLSNVPPVYGASLLIRRLSSSHFSLS